MHDDPYLQKNGVLINKKGITTQEELDVMESQYISLASRRLYDNHIFIKSTKDILKIHKALFDKIFDWAGSIRTITMYKAEQILDGCSVDYTPAGYINKELDDIDKIFQETNFKLLDAKKKIIKISEIVAEVWRIHPFREGNTRSTSFFLYFLLIQNGFTVRRDFLYKYSKYFRNSLVLASLYSKSEPEYLQGIIEDIVSIKDVEDGKYKTINGFDIEKYNFCYHTLERLKTRCEKNRN